MNNYTKGEWILEEHGIITDEQGKQLASVSPHRVGDIDQQLANATLMVTAPDLRNRLRELIDAFIELRKLYPTAFNMLEPNQRQAWIIMRDACANGERALSKAEGK